MTEPVWTPDPASAAKAAITRFAAEAGRRTRLDLNDYRDLQAWSVRDLSGFWGCVADFFDLGLDAGGPVLAEERMPGATWFPRARLNYAAQALRHGADPDGADTVAVTAVDEDGVTATLTWAQLRAQVGAFAATLRALGAQPGDRVVGYLPNIAETLVAFLATASIGAVWSACAQDYSAAGAAARFGQLEPVVLVAADGYRWNGRVVDRRGEVSELRQRLPSLRATVHVPHLGLATPGAVGGGDLDWATAVSAPADPRPEPVAFDAPLWVLFSSGTTGRPKGIVHGHGGIVTEHCKLLGLHQDLGPGRPLFWYTSTNWMMWNIVASGLLVGAPVVLYDGSPTFPDPMRLWRIAADHGAAVLGVSPGYLTASDKAGLHPGAELDLSCLRSLGVTGAPLTAAPYYWVRDQVGSHVQTASTSGGTDVASGFAGTTPVTPVWPGEISVPLLGVALESWDDRGQPRTGQVGELVVTKPMPSMPLRFWDDPDGSRYRDAYFSTWPGVWRHGDWVEVTGHGGLIVSGRSDATLNRRGVRLGSADIYTAIEVLPAISDSLVIGAELGDGDYWLVLFVVLADGNDLTGELTAAIKARIRAETSPRHVPDDIIAVPALPHTRTGKRLEVPVKRLIQGQPLAAVASPDAVDDLAALAQFTAYASVKGRAR